MIRVSRSFIVLLFLLIGAFSATADTLNFVTTSDTGGGGTTTINPDGSIRLQTVDAGSKASVKFYSTSGAVGTLGTLTNFSADFRKDLATPYNNSNNLAIRIFTNQGGTQGLVWENNYNGNIPPDLHVWNTINFTGGNFWERANSHNFDQTANLNTLAGFKTNLIPPVDGSFTGVTFNSSTPIYGLEVSYGSGVGVFDGSVRNIHLDFTTGSFDEASSPTPLPSAAMGGFACLGLFGISRRRRR